MFETVRVRLSILQYQGRIERQEHKGDTGKKRSPSPLIPERASGSWELRVLAGVAIWGGGVAYTDTILLLHKDVSDKNVKMVRNHGLSFFPALNLQFSKNLKRYPMRRKKHLNCLVQPFGQCCYLLWLWLSPRLSWIHSHICQRRWKRDKSIS